MLIYLDDPKSTGQARGYQIYHRIMKSHETVGCAKIKIYMGHIGLGLCF